MSQATAAIDEPARSTEQTLHVTAVTVKLPPFYTSNARFWFAHAEQQFFFKNITADDTKFGHLVTAIQEDVALKVMEAIESPPDGRKYDNLKDELLRQFTLSPAEMAETLLNLPGLGDQRPSHLLQKILSLHPKDDKPNFLTRAIFLRQLPEDVRGHLTDKTDLTLVKLATEADKFFATSGQRVNAVAQSQQQLSPAEVEAVQGGHRRQTPNPRDDHNRRKSYRPEALCFYHRQFGIAARKCRSPCSFVQGN